MQSDQRGVHGEGDDRQVEVVEHDGHVVVQAPVRVEVEPQRAAADQGHGGDVRQPGEEKKKKKHKNTTCLGVSQHTANTTGRSLRKQGVYQFVTLMKHCCPERP